MAVSKVKWGGDWVDALEGEWDEDESGGYETYEGPRPPKGVYMVKVRMEQAESTNGNDQVIVHCNVSGAFKPEHRKYDGYYFRDYLTFTPKTGFRTRPFLKVLGVTPREFVGQTGVDENGTIRQIGKKKFTDEFFLVVSIRPDSKNNPDYEQVRYLRAATPEDVKGSSAGGSNDDTDAGDALPEADEDALPTPF
jgi:hypothetical protein